LGEYISMIEASFVNRKYIKGGLMKKPFFIRLLVDNKTIATIYPTPGYAGRHLLIDVEKLASKYGKPVKAKMG
jgi:hypothetical protein